MNSAYVWFEGFRVQRKIISVMSNNGDETGDFVDPWNTAEEDDEEHPTAEAAADALTCAWCSRKFDGKARTVNCHVCKKSYHATGCVC